MKKIACLSKLIDFGKLYFTFTSLSIYGVAAETCSSFKFFKISGVLQSCTWPAQKKKKSRSAKAPLPWMSFENGVPIKKKIWLGSTGVQLKTPEGLTVSHGTSTVKYLKQLREDVVLVSFNERNVARRKVQQTVLS